VAALLALLLTVQALTVERSTRARQALDLTPLDVAFLDADRVFVLSEDTLSLYRIESTGLALLSRLALPGAPARSRAAAGMLRVVPQDGACWALSNRRAGATLFNVEGDRLAAVAGAEAIPPTAFGTQEASPDGVRFVAGTNLLAVGGEALLRFAGHGDAVERDGVLRLGGAPDRAGRRAGNAMAVIDDRLVAVSSPGPPGGMDEIRILERNETDPIDAWPTGGSIRGLAARSVSAGAADLAVAVESEQGPSLEILGLLWSRR
jgi:hypothetical protein